MYNHFHDNDVLTPLQSGFIPGDSTVNQLTFLYDTFCKALDSGKEVRVVFCDISKAFDRVWHAALIYKLRASGVSGNLLRWFENYLQNRCQRVVIPGAKSDWNYIVKDIGSNIRLFADDTSLYIIVENPEVAADILNTDLAKVAAWAKTWLVTFNALKTESLLISRKHNQALHAGSTSKRG